MAEGMRPFASMRFARYGLALVLVALALALTLVLQHFESTRPTLFLFFAAIVAAAWFGGVGPGCLAAALSIPAGLYFYSSAVHALTINLDNLVMFFFFAACALAGGVLSSRQRAVESGLQRTHEELQAKAAELTRANDALKTEMAERRRTEDTLRETQARLTHAARLTAMGELVASIAHEINQPLAALLTNAGSCVRWLQEDNLDIAEARDAAESVVQDGTRASEVIRRIRAMVRRTPPEKRDLDVNALVREAIPLLERELRQQRVEVDLALAESLPPVSVDPIQLQQVILNLLLNSIEAMSGIGARPRRLNIGTRRTSLDEVEVEIADTGGGFASDDPENAFEAFVTSKPDGLGLGLSICRSIVEGYGGRISAAQREPFGAVVRVLIPSEKPHDG